MQKIQPAKMILLMAWLVFSMHLKAQPAAIIPRPAAMEVFEGTLEITENMTLVYEYSNEELARIAMHFSHYLTDYYNIRLSPSPENKMFIQLELVPSLALNKEGYQMRINQDGIVISATSSNGIFYGIQTLKQLLPVPGLSSEKIEVPFVQISDQPRFVWRGLMLDVGRHFFPVAYIKNLLDYMAVYKLNTFHWHLTEDQGWRIEIKKYPALAELAHWRDETILGHASESETYDGIGYGGFYTQDQIKEIVQYAADRYITVVPEIEMPGHSSAALAAYPELGCTRGPYEVKKTWGVMKDVYCAGRESTFQFLEDVMDEVCGLFPSAYIHVGGDECPKDAWENCSDCQKRIKEEGLNDEHELQSYFIRRIEKYLNSRNKKLVGWDEIIEGGLPPDATVMSWRGEEGGIEAAKRGHDVVMTPMSHCYFDFYQKEDKDAEPLAIGGYLPLDKVYHYEPIPKELNAQEAKHILGPQGNVWTEYIANTDKLEYMLFPRICALSEVAWSPRETKDFADFQTRMETEYLRLKVFNIHYCDHSD